MIGFYTCQSYIWRQLLMLNTTQIKQMQAGTKNKIEINSTTNVKKLFPCVRDQKQLCNRVFNVSMSAQK